MSGLRPAVRIARRDLRRAPGRSLLILLMVALPVSGAAFVDVVLRTVDVRGPERIAVELGRAADARVLPQGVGPIVQEPHETYGSQPSGSGTREAAQEPPEVAPPDARELLPPGSRWIADRRAEVQVRTADGLARAALRELDIADPLAQGLFTPLDGRAPRDQGEVAVTPRLLEVLGLGIGDDLTVTRPERQLRIVGTVRPVSGTQGAEVAVTLPGAVLSGDGADDGQQPSLLVDTPGPVTWADVLAFNEVGVAVFSRAVVQNPPEPSAVPYYDGLASNSAERGPDVAALVTGVLVVGLAVVEVALLAGAAFAVGIRRQSRVLGLLAATGAQRRQVRAVVLAQGLFLGTAGGLVGVLAGTLAGVLAVEVAAIRFHRYLPAPDLRPLELLALTLVGVATGVLAAVLPARTAARQDVVAALSGRRGILRTRRRYPAIGLATAGLGAALALGGGALALALQQREQDPGRLLALVAGMILVGAVLTQLGLILATPALIGAAARLGRFLPLAPRLALRDAARNRGRSAPAVAAVLGAVAGSVALTLFVASTSDKDERNYLPSLGNGQGLIRTSTYPGEAPRDADALLAAVRRIAPPDDAFEVRSFPQGECSPACRSVQVVAPPANRCPLELASATGRAPSDAEQAAAGTDPRCTSGPSYGSPFSGPVVGGYDDFVRLTGLRSPEARSALEAGGMVVFDERQVLSGRGVVEVSSYDAQGSPLRTRAVDVPATWVDPRGRGYVSGFLSPAAARAVGVPVRTEATVVQYDVPPDDDTEEAISAALAEQGQTTLFQVERGYRDGYGLGLVALVLGSAVITLGASGVATGLAQADARADHATLAAVGAAPGLRRRLTAFQAAVVAGLGTLLGTVSGFVPMVAYLYADTEMRFVAPWQNLLVLALVVPAAAALCAGLLTRSRLPLGRRLA